MMRGEDLKTIAHLGQALWSNPGYSERVASESLAAVSLLDLSQEKTMDKLAVALLQRAARDGGAKNAADLNHPFFRLSPQERFLLSMLHSARWSYDRLGRVLTKSHEEIGQMAWAARIKLISAPGLNAVPYPIGGSLENPSCPDYDHQNPWTQKFLDAEMGNRERVFIQNHLLSCDRCRVTLARARNVYYVADTLVPRNDEEEQVVRFYQKTAQRARLVIQPHERTFLQSLEIFIGHRDVQLIFTGIALFIIVNLIW